MPTNLILVYSKHKAWGLLKVNKDLMIGLGYSALSISFITSTLLLDVAKKVIYSAIRSLLCFTLSRISNSTMLNTWPPQLLSPPLPQSSSWQVLDILVRLFLSFSAPNLYRAVKPMISRFCTMKLWSAAERLKHSSQAGPARSRSIKLRDDRTITIS